MKSQYSWENKNRYITAGIATAGAIVTGASVYTENYWTIPLAVFGTLIGSLLFIINKHSIRSENLTKYKKNNLENLTH